MAAKYCSRWVRINFYNYKHNQSVFVASVKQFLKMENCFEKPCVLVLRDSLPESKNLCFIAYKPAQFHMNNPENTIMFHFDLSHKESFEFFKKPCGGAAGNSLNARRRLLDKIKESTMWDTINPVMCTGSIFKDLYPDFGFAISPPFFTKRIPPAKRRRTESPSPPPSNNRQSPMKSGGHLIFGLKDGPSAVTLSKKLERKGGTIINNINTEKMADITFGIYITKHQSLLYARQLGSFIGKYKMANKPLVVIVSSTTNPKESTLYRILRELGVEFNTCLYRNHPQDEQQPSSLTHPDDNKNSTGSTTPPLVVSNTDSFNPEVVSFK